MPWRFERTYVSLSAVIENRAVTKWSRHGSVPEMRVHHDAETLEPVKGSCGDSRWNNRVPMPGSVRQTHLQPCGPWPRTGAREESAAEWLHNLH